jgi:dienelactone hydrolase
MSDIALFHPSMGVTAGVRDAARRLSEAGHDVLIADQYDGRVFQNYDEAASFVDDIGFPELMRRALVAVAELADGFLVMGFSNGGGMATYVALNRRVAGVILCSGALPLNMIGADAWPSRVPAQLHAMVDDPRKPNGHVESVMRSVNEAGADAEYFQYPGHGHLFTDAGVPEEYDVAATQRLWERVIPFCALNAPPHHEP